MGNGNDLQGLNDSVIDSYIDKEKHKSSRRGFMLGAAAAVSFLIGKDAYFDHMHGDKQSKLIMMRAINAKVLFRDELLSLGMPEKVVENILNSIVIIFCNGGLGTGFFTNPHFIMTAGHVIGNNQRNNSYDFSKPDKPTVIYDLNGNRYDTQNVYGDKNNDLSGILVSRPGVGFIDVFKNNVEKEGGRISVGFGGKKGQVTKGHRVEGFKNINFNNLNRGESNLEFITNPVIPGDSGGPIFDMNGNLTGITVIRNTPDYKIYDNKKYPGVPFHVDLKFGGIESLEDVRNFIKNI